MSALDDAASMDPWAHRQLQCMKEELNCLRADNYALKVRNEKLESLLRFALDGLKSTPHSWGLDITHVEKIDAAMRGEEE